MTSVLLCSTPVHGHVAPMLNVARALRDAGWHVRFLTGARYRDAVVAAGAEFLPLPAEADYDDRDLNAAFPGRSAVDGLNRVKFDVKHIFLAPVPAQLDAVRAALAAEPTDAVIAETMFAAMGALALEPLDSRPFLVSLGIIPLAVPSADTAPFGLGLLPMQGPVGRLRNRLLAFGADRVVLGPLQREARSRIEELTGHRMPGSLLESAALVDLVAQCTVPEFEYHRSDLPRNVRFVGPVTRVEPSSIPLPDWWGDLASAKRVVHVTQGTIANRDFDELVRPTIDGLADDDVLVVVSTGGRPVDELGPVPANVRVAPMLPYDKLLPLVDVMVTNGGYGGVHQALERGIPLVVAGDTEDKPEVAARVEWSGAGVNLRTGSPRADAVADAVRRVLAEDRFAEASARIGTAIAASPRAAGLVDLIGRGIYRQRVQSDSRVPV
ncbi:glycosyltransferase [Lysobacter korlensis]|uniref:Glycosyltransferase n=1 Tax=Lysobacter korlensis TaxID=553636 RepID=A0ABV6RUJ6_9GAMM